MIFREIVEMIKAFSTPVGGLGGPLGLRFALQPTVAADGKQYYQAISSETLKPVTDWLTEKRPANYKPSQPSATTSPTSTPSPKSNKGTKSKATTGTAARPSRS